MQLSTLLVLESLLNGSKIAPKKRHHYLHKGRDSYTGPIRVTLSAHNTSSVSHPDLLIL